MRLYLVLLMGLMCAVASPIYAQGTSENNVRLKKMLENFPKADADKDGVLTLKEAVVFGRKSGALPKELSSKSVPKQNPADIEVSTFGKWKVFKNVQYDTKHERNVLDYYQADSKMPTPVVVYFHGGGFQTGDKGHAVRGQAKLLKKFLEAGISFATCNYPFLKDADYLAIMGHCARSIQFIRSKEKEWNIDPKCFGAYGVSAGTLISEWIAYSPEVARPESKDTIERLPKSLSVVGAHLQPRGTEPLVMNFMKPGGTPLFIFGNSAANDKIHDPKFSKMIKEKADELGIPAVLVGGGRNDIPVPADGADPIDLQFKFFEKYLRALHSDDVVGDNLSGQMEYNMDGTVGKLAIEVDRKSKESM